MAFGPTGGGSLQHEPAACAREQYDDEQQQRNENNGAAASNVQEGMILDSWLSWLDKLVNECLDSKGKLDLAELEKRFGYSKDKSKTMAQLADRLWRAIDEGDVSQAEALLESLDKDQMLRFGKCAIKSICKKDQEMVDGIVKQKQVWKLVQLVHFGSIHQQALAHETIENLLASPSGNGNGGGSVAMEAEVKRAQGDIETIQSVLVPYQKADVKRLVHLLKSGSVSQQIMAAQALNGLCGMGLSEQVAKILERPVYVKKIVHLLEEQVSVKKKEEGSSNSSSSPLLEEWIEDFSLPPKISLAGLFGALGTHRPQSLHQAIKCDVLSPLTEMIGRGSGRERELVASLLLVMMTANEEAWRAAKANPKLKALDSKKREGMLQEVARCLDFEGTHEELSDHMLEISKPK
jgi:hypothetical protein